MTRNQQIKTAKAAALEAAMPRIRELHAKGLTGLAIARAVGLGRERVRAAMLADGLYEYRPKMRREPFTPCDVDDKPIVTTPRACMCCRRTFDSEGPHNRLCTSCRQGSGAHPGYAARGLRGLAAW